MSHVSFYRKWRPKSFEEVIGQERVTRTLQNAIKTNRVVHAYLFAGHRGTGKTTTARILAKALNCAQGPTPTPDNACDYCEAITNGSSLDVIEIDAATNRGIDEIRELRDRIRLTPSQLRYKVYIIDEAHMLTTEGANALLKTLEEPPAHAVLVLVTTEPHRLPPTILSRCQRFDFRRVSHGEIVGRLRHIAQTEGFAIEEPALVLIGASADGSVRDAESILDQLAAFAEGPIKAADVQAVLGMVAEDVLLRFADAIIARDAARCLDLVGQMINEGKDARQVMRTLLDHFRDLLVLKTGEAKDMLDTTEQRLRALQEQAGQANVEDILRTLNVLSAVETEARWNPQPRLLLEIALIRICRPEMDPTIEGLRTRVAALEQRLGQASTSPAQPKPTVPKPDVPQQPIPKPAPPKPAPPKPVPTSPGPDQKPGSPRTVPKPGTAGPMNAEGVPAVVEMPPAASDTPTVAIEDVRRQWARILEEVKRTKMFCHALLIEGMPLEIDGGHLVIGLRTGYNFHVENLHRPENRAIVEGAVERVLHQPLRLRCRVLEGTSDASASTPAAAASSDPVVAKAMQLFGGQVVEIKDA